VRNHVFRREHRVLGVRLLFRCRCYHNLISLSRLQRELNRVLAPDKSVSLHPPLPHSFGQLIWRTNLLGHSLELLEQHKKYYPSNSLPRVLAVALVCTILSFVAFVISAVVE